MTNQVAISLLDQIRHIILYSKSWLPRTHDPINEVFDMAISALQAQDVPDINVGDMVSRQKAIDSACKNNSAKRLSDLIFDINPDEICEQIKSGSLKNWCVTMQTEMGMALIQLPCWAEGESE